MSGNDPLPSRAENPGVGKSEVYGVGGIWAEEDGSMRRDGVCIGLGWKQD